MQRIAAISAHAGAVYCLEQGRQRNTFFSGSADKFVAEWNLHTFEQEKFTIKLEYTPYSLCYLKEKSRLLIGTSAGGIHVIDTTEKKEIRHLALHNQGIYDLKHIDTFDWFTAASGDGSISVWNTTDFSLVKKINLSSQKIRTIAVNTETNRLVVGCGEGNIYSISIPELEVVNTIKAHQGSVYALNFESNNVLLSGGKDAHLNLWDFNTLTNIKSIPAHNFAIYSIQVLSESNEWVTASRDKTIKRWNAQDYTVKQRIDKNSAGHINSVNTILKHSYNNYLITASDDRQILIWKQ